jgi:hypothetical protein
MRRFNGSAAFSPRKYFCFTKLEARLTNRRKFVQRHAQNALPASTARPVHQLRQLGSKKLST